MPSKIKYESLFRIDRFSPEISSSELELALSSDKARVIFSSPFRRLQQKTQVFGLETNAGVRSRLTHTLEVANTGGAIAKKIADELIRNHKLDKNLRIPFIEITETCCLLHDIGNPPFGHFGEAAIQKWFKLNWENVFKKTITRNVGKKASTKYDELGTKLINDFLHFDGNPQGIRIILHLKNLPLSEDFEYGYNLTHSQVLACVKYVGNPNDVVNNPSIHKKAGFFHSEENKIEVIRKKLKWKHRFPTTYIMEAADDISYCLSDIEDGIEKNIISPDFFFKELARFWEKPNLAKFELENLYGSKKTKLDEYETPDEFYFFKIRLTRNLIQIASELFLANEDLILKGTCKDLLNYDEDAKKVLKALKLFAKTHLYRSKEAEYIELAGYKIIFEILENYRELLELSHESFAWLIAAEKDVDILKGKNLDIHWRLFHKLPQKHKDAYKFEIKKLDRKNKESFELKEWYYRAHLIVDYVSGMTDNFALETFRTLNGITIHNHG